MKLRLFIQKMNKYIHTPVAMMASLSIVAITTTSFLPIQLTNEHQQNKAYAMMSTDESGKVTEVQDEYRSEPEPAVTIPTEAPSVTDIMPDNHMVNPSADQSVVGTIVSEALMHTDQKGHPVSMQVQRQLKDNEYVQDTAKIDIKEAALTVDMLRRDTGSTAYLSMPAPPEMPPAAELAVVLTSRAQKLFADSQLGISIQAWHGRMTIPRQALQSDNTDITIRLGSDHQTVPPQGALGTTLKVVIPDTSSPQDVWIALPLPDKKLTASQLNHLVVCAEYADGTQQYLKGKLTNYNPTTKAIQFATHLSGNYTIVTTK
ncbi:hypothetical protein PQ460_01360 [Paenibacillus sp. KACC 21273]|uniref:hypothetical protein n=1 Tax=Paenibacillus sp. KACC 21273 TaxID=3025665 RepID=UPI00236726A5|nr:hypothetical protein [Paenibacillus sp. KACC 21273]WDF51131.1 hypothetical protein PQ460_01360 [Paenibacillus sp. KACC 21273]